MVSVSRLTLGLRSISVSIRPGMTMSSRRTRQYGNTISTADAVICTTITFAVLLVLLVVPVLVVAL